MLTQMLVQSGDDGGGEAGVPPGSYVVYTSQLGGHAKHVGEDEEVEGCTISSHSCKLPNMNDVKILFSYT